MRFYQTVAKTFLITALGLGGCLETYPDTPRATSINRTKVLKEYTFEDNEQIAAGDFDGDGRPDFLLAEEGFLYFHKGQENGTFSRQDKPVIKIYKGVIIAGADMNGDGLADILATDAFGRLTIHENEGGLNFGGIKF